MEFLFGFFFGYFCAVIRTKNIAFHTLGCKLNFSETSSIYRQLDPEFFQPVSFQQPADIYVLNTCSVTENADKECRSLIRRVKRLAPQSQVVVIGCYAQLKPHEIASIEGVDLVLGAKEKFQLPDYLKKLAGKTNPAGAVYSCHIEEVNQFDSSYSFGERTRAFLKVQDGCDYSCTYCTIPLARGQSRSDSVQHAVEQATQLAHLGVKEIVLTGVNLGDFGRREGKRETDFFELIQQLDEVQGIERFRISSIEPNLLKDEMIEWVSRSKKFMPHFHLPLQSGSDVLLALMKRRYLSRLYRDRVEKIKNLMPQCCIGADVIVGFPGETEDEFLQTYRFLQELPVSYLHVFTYSEREQTEAIHLPGVVSKQERQKRNKMLRILSEKKQRLFREAQLHSNASVLFETTGAGSFSEGLTENYIRVRVNEPGLAGTIQTVCLETLNEEGMEGKRVSHSYASTHVSAAAATLVF
jgi:threonylcarbamoyladenosine tRNA methylthiotransferase MtaB